MHGVTILFCSVFVSCMPLQVLFLGSSVGEQAPDYRELKIDYQLAFEKRLSRDYAELDALVKRTQLALDRDKLTAEQRVEVRRWQHKLRSFITFAALAMGEPSEEGSSKLPQGLSALILNRLRTADATHIDHERSNFAFYQRHKDEQVDLSKVSQAAKDSFAQALVSKSLELTEKSVRKYYRLFPFAQQGYAAACQEVAAADCARLSMQELESGKKSPREQRVGRDNFQEKPFTTVEQVTAAVNKTILALNSVITLLARLKVTKDVFFIFKETDFDNVAVMRLYHDYEMTLFKAARRGILPVMLAPTFRARSGDIYLQHKGGLDFLQRLGLKKDIAHAPGDIKNLLLTDVSHAVVAQAIAEIQRTTVKRWVELRQPQKFSDKKLYQWSIANEIATAQVILQDPVHGVVVNHLLNRYQYKNRDPLAVRLIRGVTEVIEISLIPLIFGGAAMLTATFPVLAGVSLMGKVIIAATAANFIWVGMAGISTALTHQRWLQLEHALLTGSSERYQDSLKLLREFHKTRRNAIVAGTIGLPMSVPSIRYAVNHMYDGSKTLLVDATAGIFAARDEFGYEGLSDSAVHEGH